MHFLILFGILVVFAEGREASESLRGLDFWGTPGVVTAKGALLLDEVEDAANLPVPFSQGGQVAHGTGQVWLGTPRTVGPTCVPDEKAFCNAFLSHPLEFFYVTRDKKEWSFTFCKGDLSTSMLFGGVEFPLWKMAFFLRLHGLKREGEVLFYEAFFNNAFRAFCDHLASLFVCQAGSSGGVGEPWMSLWPEGKDRQLMFSRKVLIVDNFMPEDVAIRWGGEKDIALVGSLVSQGPGTIPCMKGTLVEDYIKQIFASFDPQPSNDPLIYDIPQKSIANIASLVLCQKNNDV